MRFCSACGQPLLVDENWPKKCPSCERQHFRNPIPVSVVLIPVEGGGVVTIRRAIPPAVGKLALPGGFVNWGETWQQAGAREVREELGMQVDPMELTLLRADSAGEGVILLFARARVRARSELQFVIDPTEVSEAVILQAFEELAFPLHSQVLAEHFGNPAGSAL